MRKKPKKLGMRDACTMQLTLGWVQIVPKGIRRVQGFPQAPGARKQSLGLKPD